MQTVQAYQIARTLPVRAISNKMSLPVKYQDSDEVFFEWQKDQYLYVFQFGIVVFFNIPEEEVLQIKQTIQPFCKDPLEEELSETISVYYEPDTLVVDFNKVTLPEPHHEMIRLVMFYTGQSVALDRYDNVTADLLEVTNAYTQNLGKHGKLRIGRMQLRKLIGRTLTVKNSVSENLYIFDSPDITWEDEQLSKLDIDLKRVFDVRIRYRNISERIENIKDNLALFKDIWNHRESSTLEWIIIILIFVEIVDVFFNKFF